MKHEWFFKNLKVGGVSKEELFQKLDEHNIQFNDYAYTLFKDPHFNIDQEVKNIKLAKVNLQDLSLLRPTVFKDIVLSAKERGLDLCPLSLAVFLRIDYLDQNEGPYLTIASMKTSKDINYPNGLYLRNYEGKLWLRGYRADDDYLWPVESEFIFIK